MYGITDGQTERRDWLIKTLITDIEIMVVHLFKMFLSYLPDGTGV